VLYKIERRIFWPSVPWQTSEEFQWFYIHALRQEKLSFFEALQKQEHKVIKVGHLIYR
jgi:hypothetical protein